MKKQNVTIDLEKDHRGVYGKVVAIGTGAGAMLVSMASHAVIDTTAVTGAIAEATAAVAVVGASVLVAMVGIKVYKWITRAL